MKKETKAMLNSAGLIFITAVLAQYINSGLSIFELVITIIKTFLSSGISAFVLVLFNYLNSNDPRYGRKKNDTI